MVYFPLLLTLKTSKFRKFYTTNGFSSINGALVFLKWLENLTYQTGLVFISVLFPTTVLVPLVILEQSHFV